MLFWKTRRDSTKATSIRGSRDHSKPRSKLEFRLDIRHTALPLLSRCVALGGSLTLPSPAVTICKEFPPVRQSSCAPTAGPHIPARSEVTLRGFVAAFIDVSLIGAGRTGTDLCLHSCPVVRLALLLDRTL